jgi:hypothetical protein
MEARPLCARWGRPRDPVMCSGAVSSLPTPQQEDSSQRGLARLSRCAHPRPARGQEARHAGWLRPALTKRVDVESRERCSIRDNRRHPSCPMIGAWATNHSRRNSGTRSRKTPRSLEPPPWPRPSRMLACVCRSQSRRQAARPDASGQRSPTSIVSGSSLGLPPVSAGKWCARASPIASTASTTPCVKRPSRKWAPTPAAIAVQKASPTCA